MDFQARGRGRSATLGQIFSVLSLSILYWNRKTPPPVALLGSISPSRLMSFASEVTGVGEERGAAHWNLREACRYRHPSPEHACFQSTAGNTAPPFLPSTVPPLVRRCGQATGKEPHCALCSQGGNSGRGKVSFEAHGPKSFPVTMATAQWVPSLRTKLLQPCLRNKKSLKEGKREGEVGSGMWGREAAAELAWQKLSGSLVGKSSQ